MEKTSSRRAFPLDSRAVWVEQLHGNLGRIRASPDRKYRTNSNVDDEFLGEPQFLCSRDNFIVGPGDYSPTKIERHVYTPKLGPREILDDIRNYKFGSHMRPTLSRDSTSTYSISNERMTAQDNHRSDMMTIFHEHDRRQPLDPKLRACRTPGPSLSSGSLLETVYHDGLRKSKTIHLGPNDIPFGERNETKIASTSYDVQYDSLHVRPRPTQGHIPKNSRFPHYEKKEEKDSTRLETEQSNSLSKVTIKAVDSVERPRSLAPKPMKMRVQPVAKFDSSCYSDSRRALPIDISPGVIQSIVRTNMFGGILTVPKLHKSRNLETKLSNRLQKYF